MSQSYISQIQVFGFNFAPKNWAFCAGQILSIAQNTALFSLLGTTYGGNGTTTFGLPSLQSRVAIHEGNGYVLGEMAGEENVTLLISNLPVHNHAFSGTSQLANDTKANVDGLALATTNKAGSPGDPYYGQKANQPLNPASLSVAGSSQPHSNLQPYLALNWCICQYGIFPPRG